jgi:proline iminopeptidase
MRGRGTRNLLAASLLALACSTLDVGALNAQAERARQGVMSLEDGRIFYEVMGTGEPILIVHGGPGLDHNYLRPGLDILATRNTLVYYDQRGTGRSQVPLDEASVNLDAFVEDIDALRQVLGFEKVTVLGHSFGALFAIEYARRYPENLRGIVLMNPTEPGSRFRDQSNARLAVARTEVDAAELVELTGTEAFEARDAGALAAMYRVAFRSTFKDRDRVGELDLALSEETAKYGQNVAALLGKSLGTVEWWDRLGEVNVPTLVVHGRYDIPPVLMAQALADAFPQGRLAVLDSGHFPYIEDPGGLTAAIAGFFVDIRR